MEHSIRASSRSEIIRIVAAYSIFGGLWIYLSDTLLGMVINNPAVMSQLSMFKGLLFITLTAILLYVLIARYIKRIASHIAELSQAQQMLTHQKALLDIVFDGTTDAIYIKDTAGRYLLANAAVADFVKKSSHEIIGHDDLDIFPADDAKAIMLKDQWVMSQPRPQTYEEHVTTPDGERYFLSTKGAVHAEDGTTTGLFGVAREITERKKIETELQIATFCINNIADAVYWILPNGKVWRVNPAACQMLGYSRDELCELFVGDIDIEIKFQDWEAHWAELRRSGTLQFESVQRMKDGRHIPVEICANYIEFEGKEFNCATVRDISERKEQENQRLKIEKLESLGVLAGGIAHDFNNILTGIMGNISFALMFMNETDKAFKPLVEAEKASVRARELSHQLLTFARGGEPIKREISIRQLLDESLSLVLSGANVRGMLEIPESINAIEADEGQITQVFHNIILNATQAMPGGGTLTVAAQNIALDTANPLLLPQGSYITVSFTDEGCGIPEGDLKKIFDPYYTTKSTGTGLGLASVHSIVTRHGGAIDVNSVVGQGTTFTIYLPSTGTTPAKPLIVAAQYTGEHPGGSILVMDDEKSIRDLTAEMLSFLGYKAKTCASGTEAIELYQAAMDAGEAFSAVIMDLTIPGGMGGKEAAEQILAIDPEACLIVSSGYSNDPIMAGYGTFGFSAAVAKPYNMAEFERLLNKLFATRSKR